MNRSEISPRDLAELYFTCNFGSCEDIENSVEQIFFKNAFSFFAISLTNRKLLGVARVISDDIITSYIAEICVLKSHRGTGLSSKLLEAVTTRFNHTAIFTCAFSGMETLLSQNGLSKKKKLIARSRKPFQQKRTFTTH